MPNRRIPLATYRVQLNGKFRFADARELVPYLDELGITDIYASPILQARPGSVHGYDVTDPSRLNAELGSEEEFESLARELQRRGMGLLLDVVPNHMAASSENPWWMDVLENGPGSIYAASFDIDWHPPRRSLENKVLLPILGSPYAEALENRKIALLFEQTGFLISLGYTKLPVAPKSYPNVLGYRLDSLRKSLGADPSIRELDGVLTEIGQLPERVTLAVEVAGDRRLRVEKIKERLWALYTSSDEVRAFLDENLRIFNGTPGDRASFVLLDRLLSEQAYVLAFWRSADQEINYRRFFTISELVGVRVEDPMIFETTHAVTFRLVDRGLVTGLRVDHVDGLRDPLGYLRRVQERLAAGGDTHSLFYVVVEKILSDGESLRAEWPVQGTTGYDFLNILNRLFVDPKHNRELDTIYSRFVGQDTSYDDLVYERKKAVMRTLLGVEMRTLGHYLGLVAEQDRYARDLPRDALSRALVEATACLSVYRTYIRGLMVEAADRREIERAVARAERRNPAIHIGCFGFVRDVLTLKRRPHVLPEHLEARLGFVTRWQQFTGPIVAKGFEDGLLYIYNRLASLNEVGGSPRLPGLSVEAFDRLLEARRRRWPYTLNATSTHDTKRGEDVRARINVLSEIPRDWQRHLLRWSFWNRGKKSLAQGQAVPTRSEEILLYQTMIGAWPLEQADIPEFRERLQAYAIKATREAMIHTRWTLPNLPHERALTRFIERILRRGGNPFFEDFVRLQERVAYYGALNGLAQLLVKLGAPGVPDFYQGSELWDLRLVDPDNRAPVNFEHRQRLLHELNEREAHGPDALFEEMLSGWRDGRIKLYVMQKGLMFRRANPDLFLQGTYLPLRVTGRHKQNVIAFARRRKRQWALFVAPRFVTRLTRPKRPPLGPPAWGSTAIVLPRNFPRRWSNVLTSAVIDVDLSKALLTFRVSRLLDKLPVALLAAGSAQTRGHSPGL